MNEPAATSPDPEARAGTHWPGLYLRRTCSILTLLRDGRRAAISGCRIRQRQGRGHLLVPCGMEKRSLAWASGTTVQGMPSGDSH